MTSQRRTCLGCEGTGRISNAPRCEHPSDCFACLACLGSGTVSEPDTRKDAMVDAEQWERVVGGAWRVGALRDVLDEKALTDFFLERAFGIPEEMAHFARLAVPALGEGL